MDTQRWIETASIGLQRRLLDQGEAGVAVPYTEEELNEALTTWAEARGTIGHSRIPKGLWGRIWTRSL